MLQSKFTPENNYQLDTFLEYFDIQTNEITEVEELQTLMKKANKTPTELTRQNELKTKFANKIPSAVDFNYFCECLLNMEKFLKNNVEGYMTTKQNETNTYVLDKQTEMNSYVNSKTAELNTAQTNTITTINTTKDSALIAIEEKKNNVIAYMDSTTAGQIRNDMGIMGELTTTDKTSLVKAINEVNAKKPPITTVNSKSGDAVTGDLILSASDIKMANNKTIEAEMSGKANTFTMSDDVTINDSTIVASSKAVKTAYDLANTANTRTFTASSIKMTNGTTVENAINGKANSFTPSSSISSTSTTDVANSYAVKQAYDKGVSAYNLANGKQNPITISSSVTSTSTSQVANSYAVKQAYDLANSKQSTSDNALNTTNKTITGAINEVFQCGNNVKSNTVNALLQVDNSLPITTSSPWDTIISSIGNISSSMPYQTQIYDFIQDGYGYYVESTGSYNLCKRNLTSGTITTILSQSYWGKIVLSTDTVYTGVTNGIEYYNTTSPATLQTKTFLMDSPYINIRFAHYHNNKYYVFATDTPYSSSATSWEGYLYIYDNYGVRISKQWINSISAMYSTDKYVYLYHKSTTISNQSSVYQINKNNNTQKSFGMESIFQMGLSMVE